jgi:hypothetical protein
MKLLAQTTQYPVFQMITPNHYFGMKYKMNTTALQTGWVIGTASSFCTFEDTIYQVLVCSEGRIFITFQDDVFQTWFSPQQIFPHYKADSSKKPQLTMVADKLMLTFVTNDAKTYRAYMDKYQVWSKPICIA